MEKINKTIYRLFFIITIIFILLVAYGTCHAIKTDKEKIENSK